MAKTLKGLESVLKKADMRREAWIDRAEEAMAQLLFVNGDPAREWIVGSSCTLLDEYRNRRAWLAREDVPYDIVTFIYEIDERIYHRVHTYCGPWYANCTSKARARLMKLAARIEHWDDKVWEAEQAIEEFYAAD